MKRKILSGIVALSIVIILSSISWAKIEKSKWWRGQPFQKIWHAINDLQEQIDNIQLLPGPQGSKGEPGPQGEQGNPGKDATCDKQVRISFPSLSCKGTSSKEGYVIAGSNAIIKFNKNYYEGIDSITFYASINSHDPNTRCIVELYNLTDDEPVYNSQLESYSQTPVWVDSVNIIDELPDYEIDLGIKIKSEAENISVNCCAAWLFINRL